MPLPFSPPNHASKGVEGDPSIRITYLFPHPIPSLHEMFKVS